MIKVGEKYKVVGSKGQCWSGKKCNNCTHFKEGIIVINLGCGTDPYSEGERTILGQAIDGAATCRFNPYDLEPFNKKLFDLEIK
jgi:hypothetical protein